MALNDEHLQKLRDAALTDEQISALGWRSLHNGRLAIPYRKPDGTPEVCHDGSQFIRERLGVEEIAELKRQGNSKPGKYRSPKGEGCRIYHSKLAIDCGNYIERLANRFVPLRITEGEIKTEAATVHDPQRLTIGLGGVNSWKDRYDGGEESQPLIDWDDIPMEGREVRLCFDSDLHKPQVTAALEALSLFLSPRGANVLIEVLPHGLDGERLGVDDLIHRHGAELFHRIADIAHRAVKEKKQGKQIQFEWCFRAEPANTRERNVYLAGMLSRHWRRSSDSKERWQQWNGRYWAEVDDDELTAVIEEFAEVQGWHNRELNTIRSLQAAFRRTIASSNAKRTPGLIPFHNGALRLAEGRLIPHQPEHGNTWALPYDYDPGATCPRIEAFLLDRLEDSDSVAVFRAYARSLVIGERLKAFLEITGPSNTGKSVLANLLVALVGNNNTAAGKLQRLEDASQRFETLKLRGRRLAIFSECQDFSGQLQTLKALTGGDPIAAEVKGGRHLEFTFTGGVVLVGNGPVRASDPTGAVINRRRSLHVTKVVPAAAEQQLIEPDEEGGWFGALAEELPGLVNWALEMTSEQARMALARDVESLARAEAKLETLLTTDALADWAEQHLIWDESSFLRVGVAKGAEGATDVAPELFLFPSYLRFMEQQGRNNRPLSLKVFKKKLVDLLRDTLGLPLPAGPENNNSYRKRGMGSVVPCLRFRQPGEEDIPGVIHHAVMAIPSAREQQPAGTDAERLGNGQTPIGNGWNGSETTQAKQEKNHNPAPEARDGEIRYGALEMLEPVQSVPSVTYWSSQPPAPVTPAVRPILRGVPIEVKDERTGIWSPGWRRLSDGHGSTHVLCTDPMGHSRQVPKIRIRRQEQPHRSADRPKRTRSSH